MSRSMPRGRSFLVELTGTSGFSFSRSRGPVWCDHEPNLQNGHVFSSSQSWRRSVESLASYRANKHTNTPPHRQEHKLFLPWYSMERFDPLSQKRGKQMNVRFNFFTSSFIKKSTFNLFFKRKYCHLSFCLSIFDRLAKVQLGRIRWRPRSTLLQILTVFPDITRQQRKWNLSLTTSAVSILSGLPCYTVKTE